MNNNCINKASTLLTPCLQLDPTRRLMSRAVGEGASHALLTVGGIIGGARSDEVLQVLDEVLVGGEAADAEGHQDPTASVGRFVGIHSQLLANLTVDFGPVTQKPDVERHRRPRTFRFVVTQG